MRIVGLVLNTLSPFNGEEISLLTKKHKKRALGVGTLVLLQDARKLDFPGKFDALWLEPYLVKEVFANNSLQLETLNGERFPARTSGSRCKEYRI